VTLDEAVDFAFRARVGDRTEFDHEVAHDLIAAEVDRLNELSTWEANFARQILEPMADELYKPQLGNAAVA
jgi:hypothetical protein